MYVCMYVCMHVCMYVCVYIYIYTHTYSYRHRMATQRISGDDRVRDAHRGDHGEQLRDRRGETD